MTTITKQKCSHKRNKYSNKKYKNAHGGSKNEYWGYHLILDCSHCDIDKISDGNNIKNFIKELVSRIDMKSFGEPIIQRFALEDATKAGYSLVQLIETSSITGHFVELNGDAYIDIFSCKQYNQELAKEIVTKYFNPQKIRTTYLTRQA
jgi:S-adenosylmethionine decarboxylase